MFLFFCIAAALGYLCRIESVSVGYIHDVIMLSSSGIFLSMNGSCDQCVCAMLLSTTIAGVSCFPNHTCLVFHNYSLSYTLLTSSNSSFYFLSLPSEQQQSTDQRSINTRSSTHDSLPSHKQRCFLCFVATTIPSFTSRLF